MTHKQNYNFKEWKLKKEREIMKLKKTITLDSSFTKQVQQNI